MLKIFVNFDKSLNGKSNKDQYTHVALRKTLNTPKKCFSTELKWEVNIYTCTVQTLYIHL